MKLKLKLKLELLSAGMPTEKPADLNTRRSLRTAADHAEADRLLVLASFAPRGRVEDPTPHYFL